MCLGNENGFEMMNSQITGKIDWEHLKQPYMMYDAIIH